MSISQMLSKQHVADTQTFVPLHRLNLTNTPEEAKRNTVLATAVHADVIRRVKAVCECELWQMEKDRTLIHRSGDSKIYPINLGTGKCTCPDAARVDLIKHQMRRANVNTVLDDKHKYIRDLHSGATLFIFDPETDALVLSASLKEGHTKPTVVFGDVEAYARLLKAAYELSETELDREGGLN